ncbi:DUF7344 domain-containing protein [Halosolutus gelatinilyticus]|uniref:DUF7344 domain-containing protein n=1 Tax=Halosolutus gelatinilyticus TaxID=2931975 RepID=UPI001FF560DB|nr:hypothetical protein [Halosolutus gelatinilyticus]
MIDNDEIFDALADRDRRQLLVRLSARDPQRVPELSPISRKIVAANEEFVRRFLSSSQTIAGVNEDRLRLHYVHLPKLVDYGFIRWDRTETVVTEGPRFDELRPLLELLDVHRNTGSADDLVASLRR